MEFCTRRELQNQTGHSADDWPLVVLKELMDNALDACEEVEVAPVIEITVEPERGTITIQDNGGGMKTSTVKSILDYTIRVSSREAYVSPTRGAQGNALKTILAMGYVLDREREDGTNADAAGVTIIETRGVRHRIEFRVDHINNEPKITHTTTPSLIGVGTKVTIKWPATLKWIGGRFRQLAENYVWFNPHLTLRGAWGGEEFVNVTATDPAWKKWGPRNPTSAHWYDETRLQRYLAAHVARDRDLERYRTVREFISEFRGLSGTAVQRKVLEEVGCSHRSLAQFFGAAQVNRDGIAKLLAAMRRHTKPVAAKHLGVIGAEHLKRLFLASGGNAETFKYQQRKGHDCRRHPIPHRICIRSAPSRSDAGRWHIPQVHHWRQLERRDQQSIPRFRINWRGAGKHFGKGASQRQFAGDLRPASRLGLHPVCRPRQKLNHSH